MAIDFKIDLINPDPPMANEPNGRWVASNNQGGGYHLRFHHDSLWTFMGYKIFQVLPNENGAAAVGDALPTVDTTTTPEKFIPAVAVGNAMQTKSMIMRQFWLNGTINAAYTSWPDPETRYFGTSGKPIFSRTQASRRDRVTIWNRQNRGALRLYENSHTTNYPRLNFEDISPVFDIILYFKKGGMDILVDPPVRNQR